MMSTTVTDADVLAAVEGPLWSFTPKPTAPLRTTIARQRNGEPVDDLLELFRRLLANVLQQRDGHSAAHATEIAQACERAIRAEMEEL